MATRTIPALLLLIGVSAEAQSARPAVDSARLAHSVQQLRESEGKWDVETRFLGPDGSVARSVQGTYTFAWVIRDRVLVGSSTIPELGTASGILFYLSEERNVIEMVSVGADGRLWTMTGPLGGEARQTAPYAAGAGVERLLRFTRLPIRPDSFESRMHYSDDAGRTWVPGNHQIFRRRFVTPS